MTRKRRRLYFVVGGVALLGLAVGLSLWALSTQGAIALFVTPSDMAAKPPAPNQYVSVGGLVELGSVKHEANGTTIEFRVTDGKHDVPITYSGVVPDLFREGQGVVVEGYLASSGVFDATTLLAKHDARYMPPQVVEALKKSGRWQEGEAAAKPLPPADAVPASR